mgnify:CR=1 FL=1
MSRGLGDVYKRQLQELAGPAAEAAEAESIDDLLAAPEPLGVVNQPAAPPAEGNVVE